MASCPKVLLIIFFGILLPIFVFAQNQDFLSITGTLQNNIISIDSVEQRVFDKSNVGLYGSGSYEARLLKEKKAVSNNFFEIVESPELRVDVGRDNPERTFRSDRAIFNVKLPLTDNIDTANSVIEIWKGNSLLFSKKLIELPFEALGADSYVVTAVTPIPAASPEISTGGQGGILMNLVYVLIIIGVGFGGWYGWKHWRNKKEDGPYIQ